MQSRGLFAKRPMELRERVRTIEGPGPNEVIVRVRACGICGTDVNFARDWPDDPMPLGHEISGEVVEVGSCVTTVQPGDTVIVEDCTMCGICEDCKRGQPQLCRNMYDLHDQPGIGDYLCVRHNSLDRYEGLDHVSASLTEPLAVALTAASHAQIPMGGTVLVLGPGPLGLMSARVAKLHGASYVAITGLAGDTPREQARLSLAPQFGCDDVFQIGRDDVEREIKAKFPRGVDRVIVSAPPESLPDALKVTRFGGIITFFGLDFGPHGSVELDINELIFRKISLIPTFAEPAINFPASNQLLRDGLVDANALITHRFSYQETGQILQQIVDGSAPVVKAVMVQG